MGMKIRATGHLLSNIAAHLLVCLTYFKGYEYIGGSLGLTPFKNFMLLGDEQARWEVGSYHYGMWYSCLSPTTNIFGFATIPLSIAGGMSGQPSSF